MSGFKEKIRQSFWGGYMISLYHCAMCKIAPALTDDEKAIKKFYQKKFGKALDLTHPKTFSEKINWYKLYDRNPLMIRCADKVGVREYAAEKGYADCLNTVYGVYSRVGDIDFDALPDRFVIKAAHGSSMAYIVKDKRRLNLRQCKRMMKTWLKQDIYWSGREWMYREMPRRIIAEEYLQDASGGLSDYKFFCFHGKPTYMECVTGRYGKNYHLNYFDMDGNLMDFAVKEAPPDPNCRQTGLSDAVFAQMKRMAADLAAPFQQVRVDFYYADNRIYLGEMTFFHDGGATFFVPDEWNERFSEAWHVTPGAEKAPADAV